MRMIAFVLGLILPTMTVATVYDPILDQIKPGTITIIGETHKKPESSVFFQNLVLDALTKQRCVVVGLEIASDQQQVLDAVMSGKTFVQTIKPWASIDHLIYRRMIETFAEYKRQGQCIRVVAIDSGVANPVDRDLWMALSLAEQVADAPVLALLGALHTLKRVGWRNTTSRASVAEILTRWGFRVKSYPQRWLPDNCAGNRTSVFVDDDSPLAVGILNESLMSLMNAKPHKSAVGVVDGFVVWGCGKQAVS